MKADIKIVALHQFSGLAAGVRDLEAGSLAAQVDR
jgi:hypothetical protein